MNSFLESLFFLAAAPALGLAKPLVPALFIFGDSLVDVGTNYFVVNSTLLADYPPFGETYFRRPNGRYSNGLIPSDFLANFLQLPFVPPYLNKAANHTQGANFASSGAGLLDITNQDKNIISYSHQIQQFCGLVLKWKKEQSSEVIDEKLVKSIIHINIGSNDLMTTYPNLQQPIPPGKYVRFLLRLYYKSIRELYKAGARKFAISELGPLGCSPKARLFVRTVLRKEGCLETLNNMTKYFNYELNIMFSKLRQELPYLKIISAKSYDIYMDMIKHGNKYGFLETLENCCGAGEFHAEIMCGMPIPPEKLYKQYLCGDPSKHLFWDLHPTQQGYGFFSLAMWSGDKQATFPFNLKQLITM